MGVTELGKFKFMVPLAKAVSEGDDLIIEGVASSGGAEFIFAKRSRCPHRGRCAGPGFLH